MVESVSMPLLEIQGRHDLKIIFNNLCPEQVVDDKSLVGLEGKELKEALSKPFYLLADLDIAVEYGNKLPYFFTIEKGYEWNGANVPPFCWLMIGHQKEPRFRLASCVHDYMCEHHEVIGHDRYLSTLIFETLCEYFGRFNDVKRWAMFHAVDNYQKVFGGWNER